SHRGARQPAVGAEAAIVAEHAATRCDGAVDVGTGKAGVDREPVNPAPEALAQEAAERVIAMLSGEPGGQPGSGRHDLAPPQRISSHGIAGRCFRKGVASSAFLSAGETFLPAARYSLLRGGARAYNNYEKIMGI